MSIVTEGDQMTKTRINIRWVKFEEGDMLTRLTNVIHPPETLQPAPTPKNLRRHGHVDEEPLEDRPSGSVKIRFVIHLRAFGGACVDKPHG